MHDLTPWSALGGGALIGLAASLLLIFGGRVAGISGIVAGLLLRPRQDAVWHGPFVAGLVLVGLLASWSSPELIGSSPRPLALLAVAGILVGVGTRLGNGCTSGHGVCGLSRRSVRSLVATLAFMLTAMLVVLLIRWLGADR
jgi:uncharacterized membrane protein YedE/YeeE